MSKPDITSVIYGQLADAAEVQISAMARQRDLWRRLERLFAPVETPLPVIVPPPLAGPDPDFVGPDPEGGAK
jgi:hypothetical protein